LPGNPPSPALSRTNGYAYESRVLIALLLASALMFFLTYTTTNIAFCNVFLVTKEEFVVDLRRFLLKLSQHVVTYIFGTIKELSQKTSQKKTSQTKRTTLHIVVS
jgi:hypothetical protein